MITMVGLLLVVIGTPLAVWGIYHALAPLFETYANALNDPLGDKMPEDGKALSQQMTVHLPIGILGGAMATVGSSMLTFAIGRRLFSRMRGKALGGSVN
jgi:hypothetical protein